MSEALSRFLTQKEDENFCLHEIAIKSFANKKMLLGLNFVKQRSVDLKVNSFDGTDFKPFKDIKACSLSQTIFFS